MALVCKYKELINLINLLSELEKKESLKFLYSQLINRKKRLTYKTYKGLFDHKKLSDYYQEHVYKSFVNNSLEAIIEFINKSLDVSKIDKNKLKILLHLNRLIAFNFDRVLDAGLRSINQDIKDDYRIGIFNTFKIDIPWNLELLQINFCFEDLIKHFLYISSLKPFRAFNIQTAFAWGLVLEKICFNSLYTFSSIRYMPLLTWAISFLSHYKGYNKQDLTSGVIDFYIEKINKLKNSILLPSRFYKFLNRRQILGLLFISKNGCVTRKQYAKHFRISFMTAFRDLNYMLDKGVLIRKGRNNKTNYCFNNSVSFSS